MATSADLYQSMIPSSAFREHYSNLIKAIWSNPDLTKEIEENPSKLAQFGFEKTPAKVRFAVATGIPTTDGYEQQMTDWEKDASVTFYVPTKPRVDDSFLTTAGDSCCCCCCPCCCCT
jgi:hypothetical protein